MEINELQMLVRRMSNGETNNPAKYEKQIKELQQMLSALRKKVEES